MADNEVNLSKFMRRSVLTVPDGDGVSGLVSLDRYLTNEDLPTRLYRAGMTRREVPGTRKKRRNVPVISCHFLT